MMINFSGVGLVPAPTRTPHNRYGRMREGRPSPRRGLTLRARKARSFPLLMLLPLDCARAKRSLKSAMPSALAPPRSLSVLFTPHRGRGTSTSASVFSSWTRPCVSSAAVQMLIWNFGRRGRLTIDRFYSDAVQCRRASMARDGALCIFGCRSALW